MTALCIQNPYTTGANAEGQSRLTHLSNHQANYCEVYTRLIAICLGK